MDLYADNILEHYRSPRDKKKLLSPTIEHGEVNPACGDVLTLQLTIDDDTITDLGWNGTGCAISQAAMSLLAEDLKGKTISQVATFRPQDIYDLLGVPISPRRLKCALLCLHALKNALHILKGEKIQNWSETANG
ncbi:hypothetical protein A2635_03675 [Candidatus Peribacteria bacterium RIFCSPHIGHO2_01_FULL_51_9]|nr:MAG: hypothetical protein A2635_03675 [Candidatus Peribacteria bacterium RIFCSPHIGHO2_01_FULL_51_9]